MWNKQHHWKENDQILPEKGDAPISESFGYDDPDIPEKNMRS